MIVQTVSIGLFLLYGTILLILLGTAIFLVAYGMAKVLYWLLSLFDE